MKSSCFSWGFYAHKLINRQAIYSLPEGALFRFFKNNSEYLSENAVRPDQRRYIIKEEACRHYIDLDVYHQADTAKKLPKYQSQALKIYSPEFMDSHGILPWHIQFTYSMLVKAMRENDLDRTLKAAADLGHYIGDAHVPLHTTHNYDGQLTNQKGIHGLWESRVPELMSAGYDFIVGTADYVPDVQEEAWKMVYGSHAAVDSVLRLEKELTEKISEEHKFSFEERNGLTVRTYSREFSQKYSELLQGQVERQMQKAIKTLADIWYSAWIDAGQPPLKGEKIFIEEEKQNQDGDIKNDRFLESRTCEHHHHSTITFAK